MKKTNAIVMLSLWALLTVFCWFGPSQAFSDAERRPLAQMPDISLESLLGGKFMGDFEDYTLDQFPLRDSFRSLKSLFHTKILGQKDNNGIYISEGYAAKQEYPLDEGSLAHAAQRFQYLYDKYLSDARVFQVIVPDKGYYLAEEAGQLALDYDRMYACFEEALPWATPIDLRETLSLSDYYRTDTHWRQEKLLPAAKVICEALGVTAPEGLTPVTLERPFYGVYCGQAALPMEPDALTYLTAPWLEGCTVYDFESGKTTAVHDLSKAEGKDMYEVFLSGSKSLLQVENPNAKTQRELIVFRDSFGSAMIPLLLQDYARVTLVDIRYIQIDVLEKFLEFSNQDVLLLYSTLVLNNSETIK